MPTCEICHGSGKLRYNVQPGDPLFRETKPCQCQIRKQREQRWQKSGFLKRMRGMTFECFNPEENGWSEAAYARARAWTEKVTAHEPVSGLVLCGPYATGKTHLACAIGNAALDAGLTVAYRTVTDLLDEVRASFNGGPDPRPAIRAADLLILDEFVSTGRTEWQQEVITPLIEYFRMDEKPFILITNLTPLAAFGDHLATRLERDQAEEIFMGEAA